MDHLGSTHIYAFDKDFPPSLLQHMGQLLRSSRHWVTFASARTSNCWRAILDGWWQAAVTLATTIQIHLCGSGEADAIYLYQRMAWVPSDRPLYEHLLWSHNGRDTRSEEMSGC